MLVTFSPDRNIRYAEVLENLHILDYDYYFRITECILKEDTATALTLFDDILHKGFDGHNFIVGLNEHFRNLLVCRNKQTAQLLLVPKEVQEQYMAQAQNTDPGLLMTALQIGNEADYKYKQSKNQRLHIELALLKMCFIKQAIAVTVGAAGSGGAGATEKKKLSPEQV
jgi:DNA polymerase-3 subunit gamma/tau